MILVYPVLTSKNVSSTVLPGICKILERYLLIYKMDDVLRKINLLSGGSSSLAKVVESDESGIKRRPGEKPIPPRGSSSPPESSGGGKSIEIQLPSNEFLNTISLEPTWFKIRGGVLGNVEKIIGIKVLPFLIKNEENVVDILVKDKASDTFGYIVRKYSRIAIKLLFALFRKIHTPGLPELSRDPKRDILFGMAPQGDRVFLCLSKLDFQESQLQIFEDVKNVKKLFMMGWNSLIITDDVNKEATFCLQGYDGLCSTMPYNFIYSVFKAQEVFQSVSDVRKASTPFFSKRLTKVTKILGEGLATQRMANMVLKKKRREILIEEYEGFIHANFSKIFRSVKAVKSAVETGNLNQARLALADVPEPPIDPILKDPEIKTYYQYAKKVLHNSTEYSESTIHRIASFLAIGSSYTPNPMESVKKGLRIFAEKSFGKRGLELLRYILWAGYTFIFGVVLVKVVKFMKTIDIKTFIKQHGSFTELLKSIKNFAWKNKYYFLLICLIYVLSDIIKHEEELKDDTSTTS